MTCVCISLDSLDYVLISLGLFSNGFIADWDSPGRKGACFPVSLYDELGCRQFDAKFFPSFSDKPILIFDQFDQFLPFLHENKKYLK